MLKKLCTLNLKLNEYNNGLTHLSCLINIQKLVKDANWNFWLYNILKEYYFTPDTIEDICNSIKESIEGRNETKKFLSGKEYIAIKERGNLKIYENIFGDENTNILEISNYKSFTNPIILYNNIKIKATIIEKQDWEQNKNIDLTSYLDLDKIDFPINFHTIKAGEKFSPFGLKGNKKITDYLTDIKFENIHKNRVTALYNNNNKPLCIVGLQIDNCVKITANTKRILKLEII